MSIKKKRFAGAAAKVVTCSALAVLLSAGVPVQDAENSLFSYSVAQAKSCFIAGTKILMADGSVKNIEAVRAGDLVVGRDGTINRVKELEKVALAGRKLYGINGGQAFVTAEHPFMTAGGWKSINPAMTEVENPRLKVAALRIGDRLQKLQQYTPGSLSQGNLALNAEAELLMEEELLTEFTSIEADSRTWVYNLLLDGSHSYFADNYLVHNKGGDDGGRDDSGRDERDDRDDRDDRDSSGRGHGGFSDDDDEDFSSRGRGRGHGHGGRDFDDDDDHEGHGRGRGRGRGGHDMDDDDDMHGQGRGRGRGRGRGGDDGFDDDSDDFNAAGLKLRGDGSVDDTQPGGTRRGDDFNADGLKLRGDGSIDDTQPGQPRGNDDLNAAGLKLRGDGSVDDTQPGQLRGNDDLNSAGVKLRGDGSVDDTQP